MWVFLPTSVHFRTLGKNKRRRNVWFTISYQSTVQMQILRIIAVQRKHWTWTNNCCKLGLFCSTTTCYTTRTHIYVINCSKEFINSCVVLQTGRWHYIDLYDSSKRFPIRNTLSFLWDYFKSEIERTDHWAEFIEEKKTSQIPCTCSHAFSA